MRMKLSLLNFENISSRVSNTELIANQNFHLLQFDLLLLHDDVAIWILTAKIICYEKLKSKYGMQRKTPKLTDKIF